MFGFLRIKRRGQRLAELPVSRIVVSQNGRRRLIDDESLAELARSIANSGLLCPLAVRKKGARYELVSGERRLMAVKLLGFKRVSCIVEGSADESAALTAMIEDIQSEKPDFFEVGECCLKLMNRLRLSREQLAARLGKSRCFVEEKLSLLAIEPSVREMIRRYALSERHARAVLALDETKKRIELVRRAGENALSAEETEKLSAQMAAEKRAPRCDQSTCQDPAPASAPCASQKPTKPRRVVRLVKDYRVFLNTVDIACSQLRSGGLKVDMERNDREDGLDLLISVTRERANRSGAVNE